jgi:maleate isomerase
MAETLSDERRGKAAAVERRVLPYEPDGGAGARAAIGVIVLATDQSVESDFRTIMALDGLGLFHTRIFNDNVTTPDTLKAMEAGLKDAAALILPDQPLDVVAFGCTSGAMMIGDERVAELIGEVRPGVPCTSPMHAALAAFKALGLGSVAMITPYIEPIDRAMRAYIEADGVAVAEMGSFDEIDDNKVGKISPASVREAARALGRSEAVDGIFVSCSSLRILPIVGEIEAELGKPLVSSNTAMAWHCLRLAGIDDPLPGYGRLFTRPLA